MLVFGNTLIPPATNPPSVLPITVQGEKSGHAYTFMNSLLKKIKDSVMFLSGSIKESLAVLVGSDCI